MLDEIERLEAAGWYREHYQIQKRVYHDWNDAVWNHQWWLDRTACDQCRSVEICIRAGGQSICLPCLNEFPNTPWHPTGAVVPKARTLVQHADTCSLHLSPGS